MAAEEHVIAVPDNVAPWTLVFEVADATPSDSWVLVGGLMVHAHAIRAGVNPPRPTGDIDLLLNIGARTVSDVAAPLQSLGFHPLQPSRGAPFHRFTRGEDIVDVMVANDAPSARWSMRPLLRAPAARQALHRSDRYVLDGATNRVAIGIPDSLSALVVKAAAHAVEQRDRGRHLEDLAVLFATIDSVTALGIERLTSRDKRHLQGPVRLLSNTQHVAWSKLTPFDQAVGQQACSAVLRVLP